MFIIYRKKQSTKHIRLNWILHLLSKRYNVNTIYNENECPQKNLNYKKVTSSLMRNPIIITLKLPLYLSCKYFDKKTRNLIDKKISKKHHSINHWPYLESINVEDVEPHISNFYFAPLCVFYRKSEIKKEQSFIIASITIRNIIYISRTSMGTDYKCFFHLKKVKLNRMPYSKTRCDDRRRFD